MHILLALPGHLCTVPMGRFTAQALQRLGHQVTVFDFRSRCSDKLRDRAGAWLGWRDGEDKASMNARLRRLIDASRPELFVTLFGFDLSPYTLAHLRQRGIPSACWWINDPFQFQRSLDRAKHYDVVFTNDAHCVAAYRAGGVAHAVFLPCAIEPSVHRPLPPQPELACEVCFAGDWSPLREQLLSTLARRFAVRVFGPWGKKLAPDSPLRPHLHDGFFTPEQMVAMFSSAQLVLNLHTWHGEAEHGLNPRLFEAAGCGVAQAVDWKAEMPALFDTERELLVYRHLDEAPAQIAAALADPLTLRQLGTRARQRVLAEHTYEHRLTQLLTEMGRPGA